MAYKNFAISSKPCIKRSCTSKPGTIRASLNARQKNFLNGCLEVHAAPAPDLRTGMTRCSIFFIRNMLPCNTDKLPWLFLLLHSVHFPPLSWVSPAACSRLTLPFDHCAIYSNTRSCSDMDIIHLLHRTSLFYTSYSSFFHNEMKYFVT